MCGIYGELMLVDGDVAGRSADAAVTVLTHRGPDDEGVWRGNGICLGARRLSIIDLERGRQPMADERSGCVIVYNGELYNFRELRADLTALGHVFRTQSDTEVVLRAYEQWGVECLRRFNGMFAFGIWDGRSRTLFLARDRIGEKPLYYYRDARRIVFASEIKAIIADPAIARRVNLRGLANFLAFGYSVAPTTIYDGVRKLLPGHYAVANSNGFRLESYWHVGARDEHAAAEPPDEYGAAILELLDDSVRRRMVADVPVGAFLSGGLDSSTVVALMCRHTPRPVATFSLGFPDERAHDELPDARRIAAYLGTEHHELAASPLDLVETVRTLAYHYDEPFGDPAGLPLYLLSRFAREHVKVVLTGDGGDELFGGYRRYVAEGVAPIYQRLPDVVTGRVVPRIAGLLPRTRRTKRIASTLPIDDPARRYAAWLLVFTPELQAELLEPEVARHLAAYDPTAHYGVHYDGLSGAGVASDHLNRLLHVDLKSVLPDAYLEKTDKATMACGLEARIPLLDHRLVELAFRIPGRHKIRGFSTKRVFKRAVEPLLPRTVLAKRKHGFSVPTDSWFRGELKNFAFETLLDDRARRRGYFNVDFVERLWKEHVAGRRVWDTHLWLLLNFELWHRIYLDGERA